ncbi:MAG: putative sugar O-methyltransferase [Rhodocyclales bacterium]|nr:putative sugar O-methyltransferase [Rhodocyclales bacterium]
MAYGLRQLGWAVGLIYYKWTPFDPEACFDFAIEAESAQNAHAMAKQLAPHITHVFSGAIDEFVMMFCRDKPSPVVIDLNDVFAPSLFDYCHERFEPTREALALADGFCARDLQIKSAEKIDNFKLPRHLVLFPEYCGHTQPMVRERKYPADEVHVVSVGTFSLETQGMYDSGYLRLAHRLINHGIHLHIFPHWAYRRDHAGSPHANFEKDFADFLALEKLSSYLHVHESLPIDELAKILPDYDFGIISGGCSEFGQNLKFYRPAYLEACYSGRISDYLEAGLPVLINDEVKFDFWLLKRYGVCADLKGILKPGFKRVLLDLKHDKGTKAAMGRATQRLSVTANSPRLAKFYLEILSEGTLEDRRVDPIKGVPEHTHNIVAPRSFSIRAVSLIRKCIKWSSPRVAKILLPYRASRLFQVRLHNALRDIQSAQALIGALKAEQETLLVQTNSLELARNALANELRGGYSSIARGQNTIAILHSELAAVELRRLTHAKEIEALEQNGLKLERNMVLLQQEKALLEQDNDALEQAKTVLQQDKAVLQQDNVVLQQDKAVLQQDNVVLEQNKAIFEKNMALLQHDKIILEQTGVLLGQDIVVLRQDKVTLEQDNALLEQGKHLLEKSLNDATQEIDATRKAVSLLKTEAQELESNKAKLKLQIGELEQEIESLRLHIEESNEANDSLRIELAIANQYADMQQSKLAQLERENVLLLEDVQAVRTLAAEIIRDKRALRGSLTELRTTVRDLLEEKQALTLRLLEQERRAHILNNEKLMLQQETQWGKASIKEVAAALNWQEVLDSVERTNGFNELVRILGLFSGSTNVGDAASACWDALAAKNYDQLLNFGYVNFKRTIGNNYFNFLVQEGDPQIQAVEKLLPPEVLQHASTMAISIAHDPDFPTTDQFSYRYFVLLLWEYLKTIDVKGYSQIIEEPLDGNPLLVPVNGRNLSQDLANSLIEYYSIDDAVSFEHVNSVLEIGGGYGRNAYVILSINPNVQVTLVDIPPALYIAERYLSSVFKERRVFKARHFSKYEEVRDEMERASIVFLMPHQLALMPVGKFDLGMNISSLHEMSTEQIDWYFGQLNRLTAKYFYHKQWNSSSNIFDGVVVNKEDYPYPKSWREIYSRPCSVQNEFFEALYQVSTSDAQ